jgi:hypothetical protein
MTSPHKWLFVIFRSELALSFDVPPATRVFCLDGVEYRAPDDNYLTAFYDRIVDAAKRLVGIRIHPVVELGDALVTRVVDAPYLRSGDGFVDVFLTGSAVPDAEVIADQAFGGQIFTTSEGDLAVSIALEDFCTSPQDLDALRRAKAHWVHLYN